MADLDTSAGGKSHLNFIERHLPRPETIQRYRLLRPFARQLSQPGLWRMNHRSVPRGVAIGLAVGIIIPFMHVVLAALLAIPARANVLVAAACTLVVNPFTITPLYIAAYHIGRWELRQKPIVDVDQATHVSSELDRMLFWLHHASGPIALGVVTLAALMALLGYGLSAVGWRWWIRSKWRERKQQRQTRRARQG